MKVIGERKILVCGLDNSGKTSIVLSLKGDRNLLSFYSLKPTPGVKVEDILSENTNIHVWELGGQQLYIKKYLEDFSQYITNVDKIIFVIDVQDPVRYEVALGYFEDVVRNFRDAEVYPEISLFLHKFDPDISEKPAYADKVLNEKILNKAAKIAGTEFPLKIFKTTIFTVFRKTPFPFSSK